VATAGKQVPDGSESHVTSIPPTEQHRTEADRDVESSVHLCAVLAVEHPSPAHAHLADGAGVCIGVCVCVCVVWTMKTMMMKTNPKRKAPPMAFFLPQSQEACGGAPCSTPMFVTAGSLPVKPGRYVSSLTTASLAVCDVIVVRQIGHNLLPCCVMFA